MSFSINTNVASLSAQNYLRISSNFQGTTINRVTSGLRIVQSGDDAAGLAIANGYRSDQAVLTQGIRNANDGQSQLQIADGGLSNISMLLDRARTLATQSASGTFTGDRGVLNSEFQSVLGEIDRQSQAIGLDTGGIFAKNLSVFIGGGKSNNGNSAITNGSVSVDLSKATVDSKSLGLKGVQATGNSLVDISAGHATSVANLVKDASNLNSIGNGTITTFLFSGPGFGDQNKVAVAVNLNGVTDASTLATAINTGIQNAGSGGTSAATAFSNAGIAATVVTDANGAQHLGFTSSTKAFQVQAGDQMANALLGNVTQTGTTYNTTGVSVASTVTGAYTATTAGVTSGSATVRIAGGSINTPSGQNYVDLVLNNTAGHTTLADLQTLVSNNASLKAAGITLTSANGGQALQFTDSHGEKFSVAATGDDANKLGLGTFNADANGNFDYSDYTFGAAPVLTANDFAKTTVNISVGTDGLLGTNAAVNGAVEASGATIGLIASGGTTVSSYAQLALSVDGGTAFTVNFANDPNRPTSGGTTTTESLANVASYINAAAGANGYGAIASVKGNQLVLESKTTGASSGLSIISGGAGLGFVDGTTVAGTGAGAVLNLGTAAVKSSASAITGGVVTVVTGTNDNLTIGDGTNTATDITLAAGTNRTLVDVATEINADLKTAGVAVTASVTANGTKLTFTSNDTGSGATVVTAAGTNDFLVATANVAAATTHGTTLAAGATLTDLNQQFTASSVFQGAGLEAIDGGSGAIEIKSTNGTAFRIGLSYDPGALAAVTAATMDTATGFTGGIKGTTYAGNLSTASAAAVADSQGSAQSDALDFKSLLTASDTQTITVSANDSSGVQQSIGITLQNTLATGGAQNARNIDQALNTINSALQASNVAALQNVVAVKDVSSGKEQIRFLSTDTAFSIGVGANGSSINGVTTDKGNVAQSVTSAGGSTADINNQASAQNAVTALSNAVSTLGTAQAVVGRGENQFNYAVNLAQSQLTNLATAESRIRDADLAAEAANLTKAQILIQAGVAALAQANSAPQQVLTLLRG